MAIRTHYDADWGATLKLIDNGDGTYSPLLALSSAQQSSLNTTVSPLNDGQTFTGEWEQNSYSLTNDMDDFFYTIPGGLL